MHFSWKPKKPVTLGDLAQCLVTRSVNKRQTLHFCIFHATIYYYDHFSRKASVHVNEACLHITSVTDFYVSCFPLKALKYNPTETELKGVCTVHIHNTLMHNSYITSSLHNYKIQYWKHASFKIAPIQMVLATFFHFLPSNPVSKQTKKIALVCYIWALLLPSIYLWRKLKGHNIPDESVQTMQYKYLAKGPRRSYSRDYDESTGIPCSNHNSNNDLFSSKCLRSKCSFLH